MSELTSKTSSDTVEAIGRAMRILELFDGFNSAIRLRDVSRALRLSPSSAHRLLASLVHFGYVRHDAQAHRYFIGEALFALARSLKCEVTLREGAERELRRLIVRTNGSTCFAVMRGAQAYVVDAHYNAGTLARPIVGYTAALTTTASGKALLAASPADLDALIRTKRVSPKPSLMREIENARTRGFASSFGETVPGVSAIACAIVSSSGRVYGALDIVVFGEQILRDRLMDLGGALRVSCTRIAEQLP